MEKGKLYISETGIVVLYTGKILGTRFSGTVVLETKDISFGYKVGEHSEDWNKESFTEYKGEIILLKNK